MNQAGKVYAIHLQKGQIDKWRHTVKVDVSVSSNMKCKKLSEWLDGRET